MLCIEPVNSSPEVRNPILALPSDSIKSAVYVFLPLILMLIILLALKPLTIQPPEISVASTTTL